MDEEDGRPGPAARQSGHVDAPWDALTMSLCRPYSSQAKEFRLTFTATGFAWARRTRSHDIGETL
jgi:hypothetical protein